MYTLDGTTRMIRTTKPTSWTALCLAALVATTLAPQAQSADRVAVKPSNTRAGALKQALKMVDESRTALQSVKDYAATFSKKEVVGKKMIQQTMQMKIRQRPFSVYL